MIDQPAREAASKALRDAAAVIRRANIDFVTDYEIKLLCPEVVGEIVPRGVSDYLQRRADEIIKGGPLEVVNG